MAKMAMPKRANNHAPHNVRKTHTLPLMI